MPGCCGARSRRNSAGDALPRDVSWKSALATLSRAIGPEGIPQPGCVSPALGRGRLRSSGSQCAELTQPLASPAMGLHSIPTAPLSRHIPTNMGFPLPGPKFSSCRTCLSLILHDDSSACLLLPAPACLVQGDPGTWVPSSMAAQAGHLASLVPTQAHNFGGPCWRMPMQRMGVRRCNGRWGISRLQKAASIPTALTPDSG